MNSEHRSPGVSGFVAFEISTHEDFASSRTTDTAAAEEERDFIVRTRVANLEAGARYYYRPLYGSVATGLSAGPTGSFRTLGGAGSTSPVSLALVTCPNYYHFHHGNYDAGAAYEGPDKALGYPALEAIREARPDYVVWNGDNVYYDHPARENVLEARDQGLDVDLSPFGGRAVVDLDGMRRKFHEQFAQPRYHRLWAVAASYYLKDDHDYRVNDGFPDMEYPLSHELGVATFREQVPVAATGDASAPTYRTYRMSRDLQVWFVEGRDYRSPNTMPDGPGKSLWGERQREWLKRTLLTSDATFRVLVSPTPMIGPDDAYKRDNHTNPGGFRHEGEAFLDWLRANGIDPAKFLIVTGDRHWQYHSIHPYGYQEFSSGALDDTNARVGRTPGDPDSTDPDATITQPYGHDTADEVSGGFLLLETRVDDGRPVLSLSLHDETGAVRYRHEATLRSP